MLIFVPTELTQAGRNACLLAFISLPRSRRPPQYIILTLQNLLDSLIIDTVSPSAFSPLAGLASLQIDYFCY